MILMNNFKAEPTALQQAMQHASERVITSGWYVLGNELEQFEKQWADTCGANFSIGVGNGLDAIEIILRTLGIGHGDEVITTPMTAFATVLAIIRSGATPVLADIDPETALLSPESVVRCLSAKTKAVVLVHLYGQMRDMQTWAELCNTHHLELIEDCAQTHLAVWQGKKAGTFGKAGAYSFYPTKNLGALGDGGAIITSDQAIAEHCKSLRNYGQSIRYHHPHIGLNSRLDEMQAAILSERLKWLVKFTARRREIAEAYYHSLNNPNIHLLAKPETPESHVYHLFVITSKHRDALQEYLKKEQIQSLIHYPVTIDQQASCQNIKRDSKGLTCSHVHADTCLSLPCHPQMTDNDVARVIEAVNNFEI
jgi:dTDP-4-amino-4,6-dideoxygalactose transaminase